MSLPIEKVLPDVKKALRSRNGLVLVASPGSGKTTRVPLSLLDEPWLLGHRILLLEPRRLAARSAAKYMAGLLGERVGERVGYRVRMDSMVSAQTRIEVITEGVLTRMLQSDPSLEDVGLVIFDEFHERNLHSDVGLALCLQSQAILREDLKIVVMSATIDAEAVVKLLDDASVVECGGRTYPVETCYLDKKVEGPIEPAAAAAIRKALETHDGDMLVFLPGVHEIRRVEARLNEMSLGEKVRIAALYGNLPQKEQDAAIAPSVPGVRKIVLATSLAETSLTVEGVQVVVDSGLMRVPRFSPRSGMTRLETVRVSQASADQRRGRAGRLGPGICYRLWTVQENRTLEPHHVPEIMEADLAPLALELAAWGAAPEDLRWLNPPPAAAYAQARGLLVQLEAIDEHGLITDHGRELAAMGFHPRLAHMIQKAIPLGMGELACELAAVLSDRDPLRFDSAVGDADLRLRIEAVRSSGKAGGPNAADPYINYYADPEVCRRIRAEADQWKRSLQIPQDHGSGSDGCGLLLAFAYPDRIGQRRSSGSFLLSSGRGADFMVKQPLSNSSYLTAAELDDRGSQSRIFLASPVDEAELKKYLQERIREERLVEWDRTTQSVRAVKRTWLGALVLEEMPLHQMTPEETQTALLAGVAAEGLAVLPWTRAARQLQQRLMFMHRFDPSWPDMSDEALSHTLSEWLGPHIYGLKSRSDLQKLQMASLLEGDLSWEQRRSLEENAPTHLTVPSGSRIAIDYSDPEAPSLSVRLQELFGLVETPRIMKGRVPVTLYLLSPAQRPVQVTRDLASFWSTAYFEVKKDLKGRYPKHYWPDDPFAAVPTNRVRPKA